MMLIKEGLNFQEAKKDLDVDFHYNNQKCEGLSYSYLFDFLSISFFLKNDDAFNEWNKEEISIVQEQLTEDDKILKTLVNVKHVSFKEHISKHLEWIQSIKNIKSCKTPQELWKNREYLYPNLDFCESVEKQLEKFNDKPDTFKSLKSLLGKLNFYCNEYKFTKKFEYQKINAKPTSPETKKNPDIDRYYHIQCNGTTITFYWHVDISKMNPPYRIYFESDDSQGKIIIGYLGHLPTSKYPNLYE